MSSRAVPRRIFSSVQRYPHVPLLRRSTAGETPGWGSERVENGIREFEGVRESYSRVPRTASQGCAMDLSAFLVAWRTTSLPDREVKIGRASCRGKSVDLGGRRIIKKKKKEVRE